MERRRKKEKIFRGPSYNRLHGAPPSSVKPSASTPEFGTRPRVHFDDSVRRYDSRLDDREEQISMRPASKIHQGDTELQQIMKHYGINEDFVDNKPTTSSTVPIPKQVPQYSEHNQRLASFGASIASGLSNSLVAYPCLVLRRQCQVNYSGRKYHLMPFSLLRTAINMQRAQGITCLWKGIGSNLWVTAIEIGFETAISELSSGKLPREMSNDHTLHTCISHMAMKTISAIIVAPFYSAHLVESVQSEMTSESPSIFSCLTEGFCRFFGLGVQTHRLIPFYHLLLPTVCHSLLRYVMSSMLEKLILHFMRSYAQRRHQQRLARLQPRSPVFQNPGLVVPDPLTPDIDASQSILSVHYPELVAGFAANLITDIALFPFETVIHRLHIQGTRTIIDNTDSGRGFLAVSSRYESVRDCFATTVTNEGYIGLYRGFGALTLEYTLKYGMLQITKLALAMASNEH
uniref:Solute carrier family 25 member 46 n=1 Tax=Phallusia mammillata TaxID=59560 RepID=A0A6F9DTI6_9ASCI|nr:solute carrier family 25 member 46 [Phallusia mammillata]